MDIFPKSGVGALRFGMSPAEVRSIFPENETYEEWMGGNRNDSLLYHGLIFSFDKCDGAGPLTNSRFDQAQVFGRKDVRLWRSPVNSWTFAGVTGHLDAEGIHYEVSKHANIYVKSLSLILSFDEQAKLEYIEIWE